MKSDTIFSTLYIQELYESLEWLCRIYLSRAPYWNFVFKKDCGIYITSTAGFWYCYWLHLFGYEIFITNL